MATHREVCEPVPERTARHKLRGAARQVINDVSSRKLFTGFVYP